MRTCNEIRYDNLKWLVKEAGGLSGLIEKSNGRLNRPTLYQVLERVKTASGTVKNIGDDLARRIEEALKLERGWMDNPTSNQAPAISKTLSLSEIVELLTLYTQCDGDRQRDIMNAAHGAAEETSLYAADN